MLEDCACKELIPTHACAVKDWSLQPLAAEPESLAR